MKRQTNETDPPGTKSVRVDRALRGSPVNIVGLFEANRDVAPFLHDPALASAYPYRYKMWDRVLFQADDDWLANLVIAVKNVSNKEIVAGSLDVTFPQMGSGTPGDPTVCQTISLGRMPEHSLYATHDGHKVRLSPATPITIKPGQDMRFAVLPNLGAIKESIGSGFPSITAAQVTFDYVYFSDGTRWAEFAGFQKPETSVPGKYVPMTSEEFNGQTAVN